MSEPDGMSYRMQYHIAGLGSACAGPVGTAHIDDDTPRIAGKVRRSDEHERSIVVIGIVFCRYDDFSCSGSSESNGALGLLVPVIDSLLNRVIVVQYPGCHYIDSPFLGADYVTAYILRLPGRFNRFQFCEVFMTQQDISFHDITPFGNGNR